MTMKLKYMLLTSAAVLVTSTAMAKDINNPFFLPETNGILSETSIQYNRAMDKDNILYNEGTYAQEMLTYGITDNFAVYGAFGNHFDTNREFNNDHNFDYAVGMKYNHNFNNILTQVGAEYYTFKAKSWGADTDNDWTKVGSVNAKVGYEFDNGFLPYASVALANVINDNAIEDTADTLYSARLGAYKAWNSVSTDLALRWDFERNGAEHNEVYAEAAVNYLLSDDMSAGIYGEYLIADSIMGQIDYDYAVGANFKFLF